MSCKTRTIQRQKDIHRRLITLILLWPEYIIKIQKLNNIIMYEATYTLSQMACTLQGLQCSYLAMYMFCTTIVLSCVHAAVKSRLAYCLVLS